MSVTDDVKARMDIVNFIGQFTQLKKAGRNYTARCPFHSEKTPSFVVFPDRQTWRCFGACSEGGDIFNFVMKRENIDFPAALKILAGLAGVELQQRTPDQVNREQQLEKLRGLLAECALFYHQQLLKGKESAEAREYARRRGLTKETVEKFQIGFAPNDWRRALDHLTKLGYSEQEVIEAGVATQNESRRIYDRFRHRLMIPIHDSSGKVSGFGGRVLNPEDNPKYLNSPQSALFDKGSTLFGFDFARQMIRETETVVIVEGYMDAIQAHQSGYSNVVAQMGTALTEPQLKQLSRIAKRLILALDPDSAGVRATMRGLDVIRQTTGKLEPTLNPGEVMRLSSRLDIDLRVMTLPDEMDPDDLIRERPQEWEHLVETARPVSEYVIDVGTADVTSTSPLADRERTARQLLPILIATENDMQKHNNIQMLALKLRLNERVLMEWAQEQRRLMSVVPKRTENQPSQGQPTSPTTKSPQTNPQEGQPDSVDPTPAQQDVVIERMVLALLTRNPGWFSVIDRKLRALAQQTRTNGVLEPISSQDFTRSDYRVIFEILRQSTLQIEVEQEEYIESSLPYDLKEEFQQLKSYPMDTFEAGSPGWLRVEMQTILEQQEKIGTKVRPQDELQSLERRVLTLRRLRLLRENVELKFLQDELSAVVAESTDDHQDLDPQINVLDPGQQLRQNKLALVEIDKNLWRKKQKSVR